MKRIAIIDHEASSRQSMRTLLKTFYPDLEITGEAHSVATGLQLIRQTQPDTILLDVSMEDGSGFDLLDFFPRINFNVIFTAADDTFALKAFQYNALDYLLKPITPKELLRAMDKIQDTALDIYSEKIKHLFLNSWQQRPVKIALNTQEGLIFLNLEQIVYLESDNNYTTFYQMNNERHIVSRPIGEFEEMLPDDRYFRVHQSYIVNLAFVKKILREDGGFVVLENGAQLPVARRRKEEFIALARDFGSA